MSLNELLCNLGTTRAVWVVPPSEPHNTSQLFITFRLTEAHTFTSFTLLIWELFSRFQEENSWKLQVVQYNTMHFSLYKNKIYIKNMKCMYRDVHLFRAIGCSMSWMYIRAQFHFPNSSLVAAEKRSEIWVICREGSYDVMAAISIKQYFFLHLIRQHNFVYVSFFSKSRILKYFIGIQSCLAKREYNP